MNNDDLVRMCNYALRYKDSTLITPMVEHQLINDYFIIADAFLQRIKIADIVADKEYPVARNNGAVCLPQENENVQE